MGEDDGSRTARLAAAPHQISQGSTESRPTKFYEAAAQQHSPTATVLRLIALMAFSLLQMFYFQRLGNRVFASQPFADVNEPAAVRTKRPVLARKPITLFPASRAGDPGAGPLTHAWQSRYGPAASALCNPAKCVRSRPSSRPKRRHWSKTKCCSNWADKPFQI